VFGLLVAFGLGGTAIKVVQDVSFGVIRSGTSTPLTASRTASGLPSRIRRPFAPALVAREDDTGVRELNLNPMCVFARAEGLAVVDGRTAIRTAASSRRGDARLGYGLGSFRGTSSSKFAARGADCTTVVSCSNDRRSA